jgi:hypothetical protein
VRPTASTTALTAVISRSKFPRVND